LLQSVVNHRNYVLLMGTGGKLGHHSAILFMNCLGSNNIAQDLAVVYNSRSRVVAR